MGARAGGERKIESGNVRERGREIDKGIERSERERERKRGRDRGGSGSGRKRE